MLEKRTCLLLLCIGVFGPASLWGEEAPGQPERKSEKVQFTFAPPAGTAYVQAVESTRRKHFDGLGSQTDQMKSETEIAIEPTESGYEVVSKTLSVRTTRDGAPVEDPVASLMKEAVVRTFVDGSGVIQRIEGFGGLAEKVAERVPAEVAQALSAALSEDALVARETAEWSGRITDFAGAEVEVGEVFEVEVPFTLPNGSEIVYDLRTWVSGYEPCEAGRCVRIELRYDSDASNLEDYLESSGKALSGLVDGLSFSASGPRIVGGASRLMDPSTMLIYHETVSRSMTMEVEIPGYGKVPSRLDEEREHSFAYESTSSMQ